MTLSENSLDHSSEGVYSLAGKQLKLDTDAHIEPYVKEIEERKGLTKLDLSGNTLGIEASRPLAAAIRRHKDTLVEINLSDLYTGRLNTEIPLSLEVLFPALLECTRLKFIDLSDNAFGLQTIEPIEGYLAKAVTVEHLILSNNGMGPFAGARIGKSLYVLSKAKEAEGYPSLKTFICGRNRLENGSMNNLSLALKSHKELEVVRLYQNGIRPSGARKLIKFGLSRNSKLKVVDLQDNTLTTKASVALADALPLWEQLKELNLNDCLLKSEGSLAVSKALAESYKRYNFSALKLQYNELEPESLPFLSLAIEKNLPNIKVLELNGNRFEEDDQCLDDINKIFQSRGFGEIDDLDELEEIDSEDEDEDETSEDSDSEDDDEIEANLLQIEKEFNGVGEDHDKTIDEIAKELERAHLE